MLGGGRELHGVGTDIARASHGRLNIFKLLVKHIQTSLFFDGGSKELLVVSSAKVDHDSHGVSELGILINEVRHVREVQPKVVFDGGPGLDGVRGGITLLVHDILPGVLKVLEKVADRLSKTSNLPVSELNLRLLSVELLLVDSGLGANKLRSLLLLLDLAHFLQSLVLSTALFRCTATHFVRLVV